MPEADLVNARWVAAYAAEFGPGGKILLVPGETVVKVPRGEAEDSDNWEVVETKQRGGVVSARDESPGDEV